MNFGSNLQELRKKQNMSQEELSERLEVSRQAISKWESNTGYPEMDKIVKLCEIFNCPMDDLIRGKVKNVDTFMYSKCSKAISLGVTIILLGVTTLLMLAGYQNDRLAILGVVILLIAVLIAVPLFIYYGTLLEEEKQQEIDEQEKKKFNRFYPVTVSIGVSLIIFGLIVMILLYGFELVGENSTLPVSLLLLCVTIATPIFIYYGMKKEMYDGQIKEKKAGKVTDKYSAVIMLSCTFIFLFLGFIFNLWKIAWVVFPLGGILCGIVNAIFDTKK